VDAILWEMSADATKTITVLTDSTDVARGRRHLGGYAIQYGLTVVSLDEQPGRLSTSLSVTVAGHPGQIRKFHDAVRGNAWADSPQMGFVGGLVIGGMVEGVRAGKRRWRGRHDPPLNGVVSPAAGTVVCWKWERQDPSGEPLGPVWVDTYAGGGTKPVTSEEWPHWARRSEAVAYAREHGFTFFPDE